MPDAECDHDSIPLRSVEERISDDDTTVASHLTPTLHNPPPRSSAVGATSKLRPRVESFTESMEASLSLIDDLPSAGQERCETAVNAPGRFRDPRLRERAASAS